MSNIFSITTTHDPELENIYNKAMEELNQFFQMNWSVNRPKIFVVDSRATIDALKAQETPKWLVGWSTDRAIYILNKDSFATDGDHNYSENDYKMLIKHELTHTFFKVVTGGKTQPNWLWEGVSILASGQADIWKKPLVFKSFLDSKDVYAEAGYALLLLSNKYGKGKLVQLLKSYKSYQREFSKLFQETYNTELNYVTFNKLMEDC